MMVKPIRNDEDHDEALARIDEIFGARPGSPEFDELDVLGTLIDVYEGSRWPIDPPSPIDAIKFRIEQGQFKRADLNSLFGGSGKVAEVLSRKRALSKTMIVRLHHKFSIPYESLLSDVKRRIVPKRKPAKKGAPSSRPRV